MDKRADLALALAILAFGAFYYYLADNLRIARVYDPLGPAMFPKILAVIVILASLWLVAKRLWQWRREPGWIIEAEGEEDVPGFPASLLRVLVMAALTSLYVLSLPRLGYIIATPPSLALGLAILGVRNWKLLLGLPLGATIVLYLAFAMFLGVGLPLGPLEFLKYR